MGTVTSAVKTGLCIRRNSKQEYATIGALTLGKGSTPTEISDFVEGKLHDLSKNEIKTMMAFTARHFDRKLLNVHIQMKRRLRVKFADMSEVQFWENDRKTEGKHLIKTHRDRSVKDIFNIPFPLPKSVKQLVECGVVCLNSFLDASKITLNALARGNCYTLSANQIHYSIHFICSELYDLLSSDLVQKPSDISLLPEQIRLHNEKVEPIDRPMFQTLVSGCGIPLDLYNAPEYKVARDLLKGGQWPENKIINITFTHLDKDAFSIFMPIVRAFCDDEDTQKALAFLLF